MWTQFLTLSSSRSNQFCMDIRHWCLLGEDEEARCSQGCEGGDEVAAACTSVFDKQHAACQHSYGGSTREGCRYLQPGQQSWAELSYSWQMAHAVQPRAKHVAHQLPIDTVFCLLNMSPWSAEVHRRWRKAWEERCRSPAGLTRNPQFDVRLPTHKALFNQDYNFYLQVNMNKDCKSSTILHISKHSQNRPSREY